MSHHGHVVMANSATNYRFQFNVRQLHFTFQLIYINSVLCTLFELDLEDGVFEEYARISNAILYFRLNSYEFVGGKFSFCFIFTSNFFFLEIENQLFVLKILRRGVTTHEMRFSILGFNTVTSATPTRSRRRPRISQHDDATINSIASTTSNNSNSTNNLNSTPTGNICNICTNNVEIENQRRCQNCHQLLCINCLNNMNNLNIRNSTVPCPYCRGIFMNDIINIFDEL